MIIRAERKEKFTVVSNAALEDTRLSFRAKGILVFILSKPDKWQVSERHLAEQGPDGRSAVASALTELESAGYLRRTRTRQPDGTFAWESMIFDEPQPANEPEPAEETQPEQPAEVDHSDPPGSQRSTMAGKTGHGLTVRGKPSHIVNTEQVNTEQLEEEEGAVPAQPAAAEPPAWYEAEPAQPSTPSTPSTTPTVKSLTAQPPIAMYRDAFLRYPSKPQMALIMGHGIDDLRRWRAVLALWCGRGWSPTNIAGMLDLYDHPERLEERQRPPAAAQRPTPAAPATPGADPAWQQSWDEWIAELSRPAGLGD